MRPKIYLVAVTFLLLTAQILPLHLAAQQLSADLLQKPWKAQWITGAVSEQSNKEYGVYKFRKTITLTTKPASFVIHVSADNRYKLFVNGRQVSQGPARGDMYFWNFETLDIAPYLQAGMKVGLNRNRRFLT
jgi:alpha-L-rhamnosidase